MYFQRNNLIKKIFRSAIAMKMYMNISVLILALSIIAVSGFDCSSESYSFRHEGHCYSINTCNPCIDRIQRQIPICNLEPLLHKLNHSKRFLERASNRSDVRAPTAPEICNAEEFLPAEFIGGVSMVDTLKDSYRLLTDVALKMAIIESDSRSVVRRNVKQPVLDVLCEINDLLQFVDVEESVYTAEHEVELISRADVIPFGCQNLRRAVSILGHIRQVIITDMQNVSLPTYR